MRLNGKLFLLLVVLSSPAYAQSISPTSGGGAPTGAAGGGLTGTYPNPTIATVPATALPALTGDVTSSAGTAATTVVKINGSTPAAVATSGSATDLGAGTLPAARLPFNSAALGGTAISGAGTTSATQVQMGYGATCKLTPVNSTRILIGFSFGGANNTSSDSFAVQATFGTGTAPINGAAPAGTGLGSELALGGGSNANAIFGGYEGAVLTGLTPGTAYWFDLRLRAIGGGTATLTGAECWAIEM